MWCFAPLYSYYHFEAICFVTVSYLFNFANIKINSWMIFKNLTWFKTISTFLNKFSDNQRFQMKQKNMQYFSGWGKCYDPALQFSKCFIADSKCSYLWLIHTAGTSNIYQAVHSSVNAFKHIRVVDFYVFTFFGVSVSYADSAVKLHPFQRCSVLNSLSLGKLFEKDTLPEE